jgi:threonine dehydratase
LKNTVLLKREDTQPVFSFKIRGAYNKMAHLSSEELNNGVVACSAGNHAQGVALSARMLGCRAVIVMPLATPAIKVNSVRVHGGPTVEVRLFGNNYDEAAAEAKRLENEEGMTMIHPFDDPYVIAGQGTIGLEILKACVSRPLDVIFVCCGGGGMLAGIAAYVKRVRPSVKVIGVEAADAAGMTTSLREGKQVTLDSVGLFADGAAVKTIGKETFRVCNRLVDDMVTVDTDQICNAIKLSYNDARVVLEPAGALAVAGMKKYVEENEITGQTLVAITSGANMDFDRLRFVSERADGSEKTLAVTIPESPGSFRALYSLIWPRNVTEFSYRYDTRGDAHVLISFQPVMNIENDFAGIMDSIRESGFECMDVSHSELAKVHIRNMAGGRSSVRNERLFRFDFPESPGALQRFLLSLDIEWNVSLFHYRNHGDDFGRVLVGIQVPESANDQLMRFLDTLRYNYVEETDNPIYHLFLRNNSN